MPRSSKLSHDQCVQATGRKKKAARHTCACDYRHLLLILPFILSNLLREEVAEHNSHHIGAPIVDPSEVLIGVTNVFLHWYKMFRMITPGKTASDNNTLRALSLRYCEHYTYYTNYSCYTFYINYANFFFNSMLLDLFKSVFPYKN